MQRIELADGTQVVIRKARKEDALAIQAMHDRLSHKSIRYRYNGSSKPKFSELLRLCDLAADDGAVLIAVLSEPSERVIALAQYRVLDPDTAKAEPGILVEDRYQRHGIGKTILHAMAQHALQNKISTFVAFFDSGNIPVKQMISRSGYPIQSRYNIEMGMQEVHLSLVPERIAEESGLFAIYAGL